MLFDVVVTLCILLAFSLHSTLTSDADFGYSALLNLPPQCTYSTSNNYWKRRVHCENELPDFDSSNHTFLSAINELVIDHCAFVQIGPETFKHLPNLKYVAIDCDAIVVQDATAFDGLLQLTELSVQKNAQAFPPDIFCIFSSLHSLTVSNNMLSSDEALGLSNCSNNNPSLSCGGSIKTLNAANNGLTSIDKDGFLCNLKALQRLNLEGNDIATMDKEAWARMPMLERLNLGGNFLQVVPVDAFQFATGLTHLDLSNNRFSDLPIGVFQPMTQLFHLNISGCLLLTLNNGLFSSMLNLRILDLSSNLIIDINNAFQNLNLSQVDLSNNALETIDADTIDGLQSVSVLNLSNNNILTISVDIFNACPHLLYLNLSDNILKDVPTMRAKQLVRGLYFDGNEIEQLNAEDCSFPEGIEILSFTFNKLTSIGPKALAPFRSVVYLDFSNNDIETLNDLAFDGLSRLFTLNLNDNNIFFQHSGINAFISLNKLEYVDLSNNNITEIGYLQFPSSVVEVKLNENDIRIIHPEAFANLAELKTLNLQNNSLTTLPMLQLPNNFTIIMLRGNPLLCDCDIGWLNNWKMGMYANFNHQSGTCKAVFNPEFREMQVISRLFTQKLKFSFLCADLEDKVKPSPDCSSWICKQNELCPDNCTCYHNFGWTIVKVVCSNSSGVVEIPKTVPIATNEVIFYNLSLTSIDINTLEMYTNVTQLTIRRTGLNFIHENGLELLIILQKIYLDHNNLTTLDKPIFEGLDFLRLIDLSHNKLTSIGLNVFNDLQSLESLNLRGNRLTDFPLWSINSLDTISSLAIGLNPWSCNCTFVIPFQKFLIAQGRVIANVSALYCKPQPLSDELIFLSMFSIKHCISSNYNNNNNSMSNLGSIQVSDSVHQSSTDVAALVLGALFAVTALVLCVFIFIFRTEVKIGLARKVSKLLLKNNYK